MLHILKSKDNKFYWVGLAKNGKAIDDGQRHTRKEGVLKNMVSNMVLWRSERVEVVDHTVKNDAGGVVQFYLGRDGKKKQLRVVLKVPTYIKRKIARLKKLGHITKPK